MHQQDTWLLWLIGYIGKQSDMSITPLFYIVLSSYLLWRFLGTIGISYIFCCCGSWYYLLFHWEKTYTTIFTFLMANRVWEILVPQICIDFHNWGNHTCTRKLLLISFRQVILANYIKKFTDLLDL